MTKLKQLPRFFSAFLLVALLITAPLAQLVVGQQGAQAAATVGSAQDLTQPLAAIERAIETKRQELGIPGLSLAIVKDDKVIYMNGSDSRTSNANSRLLPTHFSQSARRRRHLLEWR